ncbi:hypothetical protein A946_11660 [Methylacidiphilum kamchatkense Kam1]|uniref:peptidylprolyl isomerase n=1 Tax=Methylacidiphilum kamchatkense Kam1 TaxID=1202785 RepID=A0A0C1RI75_9BACT|nr:peptidylprolyl isomerase [Methylacidiphilum kamchatkense]KIE57727.1 hypothetical protein A946_11660 [Methylacidiphilum kamchatkense Kam1]QDQ41510.1 peptidyl-prolyl cis-trans isomerase C [Methylacidiphilum kamchatkense Kam1]
MKSIKFWTCISFLFLSLGVCRSFNQALSSATDDQLLAIVNGVEIRKSYVLNELKKVGILNPDSQAIQNALATIVQQELLYQEARRLELEKTYEVQKAQDELNRKVLTELVVQKKVHSRTPTESELKERYLQLLKTLPKVEYKIRHIVLPTRRKAFEIMERLRKGENFSLVACESLEKQTADRGGELGWQNSLTLVLSALSLVEKLKPGEVGGPILSSLGWEVIQLLAIRPFRVPSFEEVKPQLIQQIQQEDLKRYVQELVAAGNVQIFPISVSTTSQ